MFILDLFFAFTVAILITIIFIFGFRRQEPWLAAWVFFVVILLGAWVGGVWISPVGPSLYGRYWTTFLITGIIFALLIAAVTPYRPPRNSKEEIKEGRTMKHNLNVFFWILVVVLIISIIFAYL